MLSLGQTSTPARACNGDECRTAQKATPLDLMKFMHRQTASTQAIEKKPAAKHVAARTHRKRRTAVARLKPGPLPVEAAKAYATQDSKNSNVQVVATDEFNAIDRAAETAAPIETNGAAPTAEPASQPNVQLVDAGQFNDIDRAAADLPQPMTVAASAADAAALHEPAVSAWVHWIWSAMGGAFVALAAAARYFFG
jgi:hypothetical protein